MSSRAGADSFTVFISHVTYTCDNIVYDSGSLKATATRQKTPCNNFMLSLHLIITEGEFHRCNMMPFLKRPAILLRFNSNENTEILTAEESGGGREVQTCGKLKSEAKAGVKLVNIVGPT